jgi:hypothetical protein
VVGIVLLVLGAVLAALLIARRGELRRSLGVAVGLGGLLSPFAVPVSLPIVRATAAIVAGVALGRVIDLFRLREDWPPFRRVLHVLSVVDSRVLRHEQPRLDWRALVRALPWGAATVVGFYVARDAAHGASHILAWPLRLGGGLVVAYAISDAAYAVLGTTYRAAGFEPPVLHRTPMAAASIQEFWGERWNRTVSSWLAANCFRPLARRGLPRLGLVAAFAASAALHGYVALVALGVPMALLAVGYFLVQGVLVILETAIGVRRWSRVAGHAWTLVTMTLSSPLFVEPLLRVLRI